MTGEAGRDAVAVAEQILDRIHAHAWSETVQPPADAAAAPRSSVVPAPHFDLSSIASPPAQREAG